MDAVLPHKLYVVQRFLLSDMNRDCGSYSLCLELLPALERQSSVSVYAD